MNVSPTRNSPTGWWCAALAGVCLSAALPLQAATPTIIGSNSKMLALRADGTLWKWGGDLYAGTAGLHLFPEKIQGISGAVAMGIGSSHTVVLLDNGEVDLGEEFARSIG